jgi:RimJ/RimL family protein N-acetyltransferase
VTDSKGTYEGGDERIAAAGSTSIWVGDKVRLRAFEPADAEFAKQRDDSVDQRLSWKVWPPRSSVAKQALIDEIALAKPQGDAVQLYLAVARRKDDKIVGLVLTLEADAVNGTFKFGVEIGPEHKGKGYAGEAVLLVMRYMFEERRFQKCESSVYAFNAASMSLHRKLGMVEEGRLRRHAFAGGEYHDVLLYGMTVEEYRDRYPRLRPTLLA